MVGGRTLHRTSLLGCAGPLHVKPQLEQAEKGLSSASVSKMPAGAADKGRPGQVMKSLYAIALLPSMFHLARES